jgi:hypothetical protein
MSYFNRKEVDFLREEVGVDGNSFSLNLGNSLTILLEGGWYE